MTHYPLKGTGASHLVSNSDNILHVIERSKSNEVAVFAWHDHNGATVLHHIHGTAFVTLPAMVLILQDGNAFATVVVYANGALEVRSPGTVKPARAIKRSSIEPLVITLVALPTATTPYM